MRTPAIFNSILKQGIFLFLLNVFCFSVFSQEKPPKLLLNYWKKTEITAPDGSKIYLMGNEDKSFDLKILDDDSLLLFKENRVTKYKYFYNDSVLIFKDFRFKVLKLYDIGLELQFIRVKDPTMAFVIHFEPKKLYDLTYTPGSYTAQNGEPVYKVVYGKLEPVFKDSVESPIDFILKRFAFPEFKKGGFVTSFVVTKSGEVRAAKVIASSKNRYNTKLVKAVNSTHGKWQPAEFRGEKVNVAVEFDFNLGYIDSGEKKVDSVLYSLEFLRRARNANLLGHYSVSLSCAKSAIDYNPFNVEAYYLHAEASLTLRNKRAACNDYYKLILLGQKKAEALYEKHCK